MVIVLGTTLTGTAPLLFALIKTSSPYWAFGFPAAIVAVFGADFVFASGTIFIAWCSERHLATALVPWAYSGFSNQPSGPFQKIVRPWVRKWQNFSTVLG